MRMRTDSFVMCVRACYVRTQFSSDASVSAVWGGRLRRSRTLRAFASAARRARVVCDFRGDWSCHARDYTRPHNVK